MNVYIKLLVAGTDTGPFNLLSDVDSFVTPFESGITRDSLVTGYTATDVPDGTTQVKVQSTGNCTNSIIIDIAVATTTTTSTTTSSSTTTTTTTIIVPPSTTTTTTTILEYYKISECYTENDKICEKGSTGYGIGDMIRFIYIPDDGRVYCGTVSDNHWPTGPADVSIQGAPPVDCADLATPIEERCYGTE
jgi:hypothetical protein